MMRRAVQVCEAPEASVQVTFLSYSTQVSWACGSHWIVAGSTPTSAKALGMSASVTDARSVRDR